MPKPKRCPTCNRPMPRPKTKAQLAAAVLRQQRYRLRKRADETFQAKVAPAIRRAGLSSALPVSSKKPKA